MDVRLSSIARRIAFHRGIQTDAAEWTEFVSTIQAEFDRLVDCGRLVRYDWMIARSDRVDYWKDFYQLVA